MHIIIAGGRDFMDYDRLEKVMDDFIKTHCSGTPTIILGGARGADALGKRYAEVRGYPIITFEAEWHKIEGIPENRLRVNASGKKYFPGAGHVRNRKMGEYAEALVAFWGHESKGTKNMIDIAKELKLLTLIALY